MRNEEFRDLRSALYSFARRNSLHTVQHIEFERSENISNYEVIYRVYRMINISTVDIR